MHSLARLDTFREREPVKQGSFDLHHRIATFIARRSHHLHLTPREKCIVALVLRGYSNKEIAQDCSISVQTVKDHLKNVYRKSGTHQRTALIARLLGTARLPSENEKTM